MVKQAVTALLMVVGMAMAAEVQGWRTDGTGRYPKADPPTQWSATQNVVWSTTLPSWGNATPILVGKRIFVTSEPATLICLSAEDGNILWQRSNTYFELEGVNRGDLEKALSLQQDISRREGKVNALQDAINRTRQQAKAETQPAKPPVTQPNQPRPPAQAKRLSDTRPVEEVLVELTEREKALSAELARQKAELEPPKKELAPLAKWLPPSTHEVNGFATPTPASDGKSVYALFGNGVAACYDLDGNRRWIRLIEKSPEGYGHAASPLLIGDVLVVHIADAVGLDVATGKEKWRTKSQCRFGSPVSALIGEMDVAVTAGGDILRAADGNRIAGPVHSLEYNAPIVDGDRAYWIENGGKACRIPTTVPARGSFRPLWVTQPSKERYYASPVLVDGLIYAIQQQGVLSVIDAADGNVIYEKRLSLGGGTVYPSITAAGKYVYVSSDNGTTLVLEPGRAYKEIARNKLDPFRACPVFDGTRMYIRGIKKLYCISR